MADIDAAVQPTPVTGPPPAEELTDDQLEGRACWLCGSSSRPLVRGGWAYMQPTQPGAPLGWAVALCDSHPGSGR
ncbi:MAG: hypothetical protein HOZ81_13450 [Streptomyces sp.]|nr:hypothetical protein [Streptomyces sp.]